MDLISILASRADKSSSTLSITVRIIAGVYKTEVEQKYLISTSNEELDLVHNTSIFIQVIFGKMPVNILKRSLVSLIFKQASIV